MSQPVIPATSNDDLDLPSGMFRSGDKVESTRIQMDRKKFGLVYVDIQFTDLEGLAVYEGDIVLGKTKDVAGVDDPSGRGIGIIGAEYRWPEGEVPFVTEAALAPRVAAAINHWQEHSPFRFKLRTDETDYLSFKRLNGCWSEVGRRGGEQEISLGMGCGIGAAVHEIGHALGLWHEQSRSDRDNFIEIVRENIIPSQLHNFDMHAQDGEDLGIYDYGSIMHYPATAFSVNGGVTIRAKGGADIGQRTGLSQGDVAAMKMMYSGLNW